MKYITIEHWERHQHYKDRRPKWIKLEIEIIEEFDADGNFKKFHPMPDDAKLTFICLLCFRANFNDKIPYKDEKWLAKQLGIETINLQPLVNAGYISICDNPVSKPYQSGTELDGKNTPETETETELELVLSKDKTGEKTPVTSKKLPLPGSKHFNQKIPNIQQVEKLCLKIKEIGNGKFNAYQFVQKCTNEKQHPEAIFEALTGMIKMWPDIKNHWTYAAAIIKTKSQNYHEAEHMKQAEIFKTDWGKEFFE